MGAVGRLFDACATRDALALCLAARRLVVQHMDARDLRHEARSVDAIFSSSSLEQFGDRDDVIRSVVEMHRVLRPGGLLCVSTEAAHHGPGPGLPRILMLNEWDLIELVIENGSWEPFEPPDFTVSEETLAVVQDIRTSAADVTRHLAREGRLVFHRLGWSRYPQIVLREGERWWTSVHLALRRA